MSEDHTQSEPAGVSALRSIAVPHTLTTHGPVRSLAEAAAARGVQPHQLIKTMVVRRRADDFLFILVPGDRSISWPKLRALLGVSRLSMPDAQTALEVTGYPRGSITPFGSRTEWPVIADETIRGPKVSIGAGAPGVAATLDADDLIRVLDATVADVTEPEAS